LDDRRPTIHDVAALAATSKSTVARALSDKGAIAAGVRDRVLAAARQLGYEPNQMAGSMRSGRSRLIGLVIPDIANPFWAEVARGAQERAVEAGLSLLFFSSDWRSDQEAHHMRALVRARVDGAIVYTVVDRAEALHAFGLPLVLIGSSAEEFKSLPAVGSDIPQTVRLGLDYLAGRGHGAPTLILGPPQRIAGRLFASSVRDHLAARGLSRDVVTETADYTVEGGHAAMLRILDAQPGPCHITVFAANDLMALGAMMALRDCGLECPRDVSILGCDGIVAGTFSSPGLTTVAKPARALGTRAVAMLAEAIEGHPALTRVHLPSRLIERGSVADLRLGPR